MKKSVLILSGVLLVSLASCGEHEGTSSAAPTYSVDTTMAYLLDTSVQFAAEWNDKQFEIVDSNHAKVAAVTASMVKGFDSKQAQFNSDIAATVSYQGQTIPFTYQIRSSYSTPSYSVYLQNDQSVRLDGVAESIAVDAFTIPEVITELPAPANEWPVKEFSYSPVARKIMNLNLSKNVEVVSATLDRLCKVVPAKEGKIAYDANGMLVVSTGLTYDKALIGVAPSFAGETLAIPATVSSVYGCAFSNAFPQVKTLTIPASVVSLSSDLVFSLKNLSNMNKISVQANNPKYSADQDGVVYYQSKSGIVAAQLVPTASTVWSLTNPLVIANTSTNCSLSFLTGHHEIPAVTISAKVQSISSSYSLSGIKVLSLLATTAPVSVSADTIMTFASDIMVKVPAELLAQYQAAANWSAIASRIVANA